MPSFIDIPTEQTTAATDALLGLLALVCAAQLKRTRGARHFKRRLWMAIFLLLALGAFGGAFAHGFQLDTTAKNTAWQIIYGSLGITVAYVLVSALSDTWGDALGRRAVPWATGVGLVVSLLMGGSSAGFLGFVLYEAVAMLLSLALYGRLAYGGKLPGSHLMAMGILLTIIAAIVQATGKARLTLIWELDHNGIFHLIQMAAMPILTAGVQASLRASEAPNGANQPIEGFL